MSSIDDKHARRIRRYQERIQKVITDIQASIANLNQSFDHVFQVAEDIGFNAYTFGLLEYVVRYQCALKKLEIPENLMEFHTLIDLSSRMKDVIQELWQLGKIWIPGTGETTAILKPHIREINYQIRDLQSEWANLERLLERIRR